MAAGSRNTVSLAAKIKNFQNYSSSCLAFLKHCKGGIWFWTTLPKTAFLSHLFPSPAAALSVLSLSQLLEKIFLLLFVLYPGGTRATQPPRWTGDGRVWKHTCMSSRCLVMRSILPVL